MKVEHTIEVEYQKTNDPVTAKKWLSKLPNLIACDFETAIKYSDNEVDDAKEKMLDTTIPKKERIKYQTIAKATALGHPSHCTITHCSIAYSEKNAYVFIIDAQEIADVVLDFLIETEKTQIWHNYSYDGRLIRYYMRTDVKNMEDTQVFAKTLLNHVETYKARTGLKDLMGSYYGDWGISVDNFTLAQQYDEHVIEYAAIDACACWKLWEYLNNWCKENKSSTQR